MPTYTFENTKTKKTIDVEMKMSELRMTKVEDTIDELVKKHK